MIHNRIAYSNFSDYRFRLTKAEGSRLWDETGKDYIDFTSGWNVTNLGWNDPVVNAAIAEQASHNTYAPMWAADPIQEEYAELLTAALPAGLDTCCRVTGGTEGIEVSIKIARAATGRKKIAGFNNSYHGQLFASLALGHRPGAAAAIEPLVPEFVHLDYQRPDAAGQLQWVDLAALTSDLDEMLKNRDVAALVIEPGIITGWGSVCVLPEGFVKTARELTQKYGTLLILDEVGTGFGRIGQLFGHQRVAVVPDFLVFAKGLTNGGAAMGVVVTRSDIVEPTISSTNLTSTFGWTPLACAAAKATLQRHQELKTWESATTNGAYLMDRLRAELSANKAVTDIRGLGLEMGIQLITTDMPASKRLSKAVNKAFELGLHVTSDGDEMLLIMPPLTISRADLDQGIDILKQALS